MNQPRVLRGEDVGECRVWQLPEVDGPITTGLGREISGPMTARDLEEIQKQAYDEGFELGRREGRIAGQTESRAEQVRVGQEIAERSRTLAMVIQSLDKPLRDMDEQVEQSLVELVVLIARQLVRRELKTSPGEIVAVVRDAVGQLPVATRHPRIHLSPEDIAIVREALAVGDADPASYRLEEDPLVGRGGCLIETATSFIDATVEARLTAIAVRLLGCERERDGERGDDA